MSGTPKHERRFSWLVTIAAFVLVALILGLTPGAVNFAAWSGLRAHAPDFAPLLQSRLLVQFHVVTVFIALALGPVQFALPKGTRTHRALGWVWAGAMAATALASLFIRDINNGAFSPIHIFSVMTLVGLPMGIVAARSGRIVAHQRAMIGLYIGLVIAGVTAVAPGRLIWEMFFR